MSPGRSFSDSRLVSALLALSSAGLLVLLFPPYGMAWLSLVALAPLVIACAREDSWRCRFAFGYAAGVVYWFGLCHWIQWTLEHHGGMSSGLAWFCFVLFCLARAAQMGVFAALAGIVIRKWFAPPAIAALWVILEWTHAYTGFQWLSLGNAASDLPLPLRIAPITGVWGVSFSLALISAVVAALAMKLQKHPAFWLFALPFFLLLPDLPAAHKGREGAVVVQPNIDDDTVWTPDLLDSTERQMRLLSLSVAGRYGETRIVVWPEVPAPFYDSDPSFDALVGSLARQAQAGVLAGVVARSPEGRGPLNSAMLVDKDGNRVSRYDKVNLVPFGEYVPWPLGLIAQKISTEAGDFVPGSRVVVSSLGRHRIGAFICYESVFPAYIRQFAAGGAQVLFNISNDSWFGKTAARDQHLLIVRMRAAENDRWIVRATNNGISGAVDPAGRVATTLPEYREASARVQFDYVDRQTFYTRFGDWFVALCAVVSVVAIVACSMPVYRST